MSVTILACTTRLVVGSFFVRYSSADCATLSLAYCQVNAKRAHPWSQCAPWFKNRLWNRCSSQLWFLHKYVVISSSGGESGGCAVLSSLWHLSYHSSLHNPHHRLRTTGPRGAAPPSGKFSPKTKSAQVRTHADSMSIWMVSPDHSMNRNHTMVQITKIVWLHFLRKAYFSTEWNYHHFIDDKVIYLLCMLVLTHVSE